MSENYIINIFHIILGTIILVLLKIYDQQTRESFLISYKNVFLFIGLMICVYHANKFKESEYKKWIYVWHFLFVAPTIMLLGFYPTQTMQILTLIATSMISYHLYLLIEKLGM